MDDGPAGGGAVSRRHVLKGLAAAPVLAAAAQAAEGEFRMEFSSGIDRVWAGAPFWANRLQDWRVRGGRLECVAQHRSLPYRTLHLLTHRLGQGPNEWEMSVETGPLSPLPQLRSAAAGFLIGAGGGSLDYRAAALIHSGPGPSGGLLAGLDGEGTPFIRPFTGPQPRPTGVSAAIPRRVELVLRCTPAGEGGSLLLTARDLESGRELGAARFEAGAEMLTGGLALVSHGGHEQGAGGFWFRSWRIAGPRIEAKPDRAWGSLLNSMYTRHEGVLRLTAQLPPLGPGDGDMVELQVRRGGDWQKAAEAPVEPSGWVAMFEVDHWPEDRDLPYRLVHRYQEGAAEKLAVLEGIVRRDPSDRDEVVIASLNCVQQLQGQVRDAPFPWADRIWFPHADLLAGVTQHQPDLYFFAGDQIYEGVPTPTVREPETAAALDYLYKWHLWCWAFGPLVRDTPSICIPDDHDVYQGNIWGMGGAPAQPGDAGGLHGGYGMPASWVNLVQRTQTSHLPRPYDPEPAQQGIGVYFTSLTLGGVGLAIIEDRKFKSSPDLVRAEKTPDSHIIEPGFDPRRADVPGATLLGERQIRFLNEFAASWRGQEMKAVLSQTIFCNLQISSRGVTAGQLDQDLDSGGWPQSGRAEALRAMRRGFMIHLAGDQHLASVVQHGVDEWEDAGWSFCAPAVSNFYTRFWNPGYPPEGGKAGELEFTGRYRDGFRNLMTVLAVANPVEHPKPGEFPPPQELHRKAPGYGIIRFDKINRKIRLECWPRYADPRRPETGAQYRGWPITLHQYDLNGRMRGAMLPRIRVEGVRRPVVRVYDEADGELLYALRLPRGESSLPVPGPGPYRVEAGDPERNLWGEARRVAGAAESQGELRIELKNREN